jgi:hypothetical protein
MRYSLIIFLLLGIYTPCKAQFEYFTVNSDNYTFYPLEGLGESINKKNQTIAFGYNLMEDTLVIAILDEKEALVVGHMLNDYIFNATKMNTPEWRNDTIFVSSEMPYRATTYKLEFVWDSKAEGFFSTEPEIYDPSSIALDKADSSLAAGNIHLALNWYQSVFYPQTYMNEAEVGKEITIKCHEKALQFFKANQHDSAVVYMEMAFSYYPNMYYTDFKSNSDMKLQIEESPYQIIWTEDQIKLWLGDYGLFLYKAKKYKESIEHNSYLNLIFPDVAGPYLQLGDSYYDSGKKTEAKKAYTKYSSLKKAQKKEKDIPKRVKERMK